MNSVRKFSRWQTTIPLLLRLKPRLAMPLMEAYRGLATIEGEGLRVEEGEGEVAEGEAKVEVIVGAALVQMKKVAAIKRRIWAEGNTGMI